MPDNLRNIKLTKTLSPFTQVKEIKPITLWLFKKVIMEMQKDTYNIQNLLFHVIHSAVLCRKERKIAEHV